MARLLATCNTIQCNISIKIIKQNKIKLYTKATIQRYELEDPSWLSPH